MQTTALAAFPGDASPDDVAAVAAELSAAAGQPFGRWTAEHSSRVQDLAGWLHCAAMWRGQDLVEAARVSVGSSRDVAHALVEAHAAMRARHQAEIAPFKDGDGTLLGNDYDDHDEVADRHTGESVEMLGVVMAVLAGQFGRPGQAPVPADAV